MPNFWALRPESLDPALYKAAFMNALYAVAAIVALCVVGIIVLSLFGKSVPDALAVTATAGMGYLVGSTATALGRKNGEIDK